MKAEGMNSGFEPDMGAALGPSFVFAFGFEFEEGGRIEER